MQLIICADDFAQSPEIDSAIVRLIQNGRLSATSCMVYSPNWISSAKLLNAELRQKAHIGLHLDFTQFGDHYPHWKLIVLSLLRCLPELAIQQSIKRQLDLFEAGLGTMPDYIDGHQHVHQLPQIRTLLLTELKRRYSQHLPWIRIAKPHQASGIKGLIIKLLGARALECQARKMGFKVSGALLGVYGFGGSMQDYQQRLLEWVAQAKQSEGTSLLMCHPAIERPESAHLQKTANKYADDPIYAARLNEFNALNSESFDAIFNGIKLVREP